MANYLVTGGCGFIGSHLVESLVNDGHNVRVLDDLSTGKVGNIPQSVDLVIGSVADKYTVRSCMWNIDACFHLAAITSVQKSNEQWLPTHEVNMTGSLHVLDAAKVDRIPVIYASSAAVYGDNAEMPLTENSTVSPLTGYGADKLGTELHARVATLEHGVPTAGMRFFNVYGEKQLETSHYSGVISTFIDRVLKNKSLTIYGDGKQMRDFIYVKDVVLFMRAALERMKRSPSIYNVCTGRPVTIESLAKMIMTISSVQMPIEYQQARRGDIRVSVGDPRYATASLGLAAKQPLVRGLRSLMEGEMDLEGRISA